MTSWTRAVLGALVGAVLTLLIHPTSRSYLAGPFLESRDLISQSRDALPLSFPTELPVPDNDVAASLWIHVGAEMIRNRKEVRPEQIDGLIRISTTRRQSDPANSFWSMAASIFHHHLGRRKESLQEWIRASKCITYNDFQSQHLTQIRDSLARQSAPNSWQYAYCYRLRSLAFAALVESYVRTTAAKVSRTNRSDLALRYATMVNGGLLRDGSRNLQVMRRGIAIVELASHPREVQAGTSIKRLLIAHSDFKEALKRFGLIQEAAQVENAYNQNDGWSALTRREDTDRKVEVLTLFSALWPNLPGVFLQTALASVMIWGIGSLLASFGKNNHRMLAPAAILLALIITAFVAILTGSALAFAATALCCGFAAISPRAPRATFPKELGPLFNLAIGLIAISFVGLLAVGFLGLTLPVIAATLSLEAQWSHLADPALMAGLALIVLSCIYLFSPLWSLAQHIKTLFVLAFGFRLAGSIGVIASLFFVVAATPICVYFESENATTFRMLMENEPVYYLRQ